MQVGYQLVAKLRNIIQLITGVILLFVYIALCKYTMGLVICGYVGLRWLSPSCCYKAVFCCIIRYISLIINEVTNNE